MTTPAPHKMNSPDPSSRPFAGRVSLAILAGIVAFCAYMVLCYPYRVRRILRPAFEAIEQVGDLAIWKKLGL